MTNNPSAAAIDCIGAADESDASMSCPVALRDFADAAALIERLQALIAGDIAAEPDCSAAIECVADVAFLLHQREVEHSLCDALDAAVREISNASAHREASARRAHEAGQLLRELARRIETIAMVALSGARQRNACSRAAAEQRGATHTDKKTPHEGSVAADAPDDNDFAKALVLLAASLPREVEVNDAKGESDKAGKFDAAVQGGAVGAGEDGAAPIAAWETAASLQSQVQLSIREIRPQDCAHSSATAVTSAQSASTTATAMALTDFESSVKFEPPAFAEPQAPAPKAARIVAADPGDYRSGQIARSPTGPDGDSGDLVEPSAGSSAYAHPAPTSVSVPPMAPRDVAAESNATAAPAAAITPVDIGAISRQSDEAGTLATTAPFAAPAVVPASAEKPAAHHSPIAPPRPANAAPVVPRLAVEDPLAPVLALSEEELIALFS